MRIIERSTEERMQETRDLFDEIKPLLDNGYTYCKSVKIVKDLRSVNTNNSWYKELIEYGESQGYMKKDYSDCRRY